MSGTNYPTQADGPDFFRQAANSELTIQSSVRIAPTVAAAKTSMTNFRATSAPACLTELIRTAASKGGDSAAGVTVTPLSFPTVGDEALAFKITGTATISGATAHLDGTNVLVRKGRVLASVSIGAKDEAVPANLASQMARIMAARM
jgi:hypothetical protein